MSTTASPGPGSGIVTVSIETGFPLALATTPRTCCMRPPALGSRAASARRRAASRGASVRLLVRRTRRLTGQQEADRGDVGDDQQRTDRRGQPPGPDGGEEEQR